MMVMYSNYKNLLIVFFIMLFMNGCTSVETFPKVARSGDTVSIMIGGTEKARKSTVEVILTDVNNVQWNLQDMGKVRSVFNLRADAVSRGMHYSTYLESFVSWAEGHEPVQTVLVLDIPDGVPEGPASLQINTFVDDDSSGAFFPHTVSLEIVPGVGQQEQFKRTTTSSGNQPVDFLDLEPAPYAKISFGSTGGNIVGAMSLIVDFDETILSPEDINVYVPQSNVRGSFVSRGSFGETQRMVYWRQDGDKLMIDLIAPQGLNQTYLLVYIIHPDDIAGAPNFIINQSATYDVNGNSLSMSPSLEYFP